MDVTYRLDKDILYIAIEGRIDAANAAEAEEKIFSIKNANPGKHTVVDAENLETLWTEQRRFFRRTQWLSLPSEASLMMGILELSPIWNTQYWW